MYAGRNEVSVSQFRMMRYHQYDGKSEIKLLSNAMLDHLVFETFHKLRKERGLVLSKGRIGDYHIHKVMSMCKKKERTERAECAS